MVYGQAWHWVEPTAAAAEAHRVLVPGGTLALPGEHPEPDERRAVLDALRDHLARHPPTAGRATIAYPYRCLTVLYRRT